MKSSEFNVPKMCYICSAMCKLIHSLHLNPNISLFFFAENDSILYNIVQNDFINE